MGNRTSRADCTEAVKEARESLRSLWNAGYRHLGTTSDIFDVRDSYLGLHEAILADFCRYRTGKVGVLSVEVLDTIEPDRVFKRRIEEKRFDAWDPVTNATVYTAGTLRFMQFFDFDVVGIRNLKHIVAQSSVLDEENRPTELLIDCDFCVFFIEAV